MHRAIAVLKKASKDTRKAKIEASPSLREAECLFQIGEGGIENAGAE